MGEANNQYQDYLKDSSEHSFFLKEIEPIKGGGEVLVKEEVFQNV